MISLKVSVVWCSAKSVSKQVMMGSTEENLT